MEPTNTQNELKDVFHLASPLKSVIFRGWLFLLFPFSVGFSYFKCPRYMYNAILYLQDHKTKLFLALFSIRRKYQTIDSNCNTCAAVVYCHTIPSFSRNYDFGFILIDLASILRHLYYLQKAVVDSRQCQFILYYNRQSGTLNQVFSWIFVAFH